MQRSEAVYSIGNLLVLIGLVSLTVSTFFTPVSGLRTGVNLLSTVFVFAGVGLPILLKEIDVSKRLRSLGLRCFTASFILSIILTAQMFYMGWASTIPVLTALTLALSGIVAYFVSERGGRISMPSLREVLLFLSVLIIFATPIIQITLSKIGLSTDFSRAVSISLLIVFTIVLYLSLKGFKIFGRSMPNTGETSSQS